jgi:ABC-2 type transport system ATP-binding protein
MNICECQGIVKVFETGHRALDELTLNVPEGSIFGFLGMNGAGKTTTIKIIAGLLRPDAGTVRLFGRDSAPGDPERLRRMGFVLDEPLYFEWMSAREYWQFVGGMYGVERNALERRSAELTEFFDLAGKREDPIGTFSTGMKKKISLGAALIHRPRFLILDEPLEGIDALSASNIKEVLRQGTHQGTTVLITSHALDAMERFCTEVAILHRGRIALSCSPRELPPIPGSSPARQAGTLEELVVAVVGETGRPRPLPFLEQWDR